MPKSIHLFAAAMLAGVLAAQKPTEPLAATLDLADQIPWLTDGTDFYEHANAPQPKEKPDRMALIDDACKRAKAEGKLVLWYIHRIQERTLGGRQMYRAPVLDIYMQQVLFADPDVAELCSHAFVPVRAMMDQPLSDRFGLKPLAFVEPAVVFLDGDGNVVHFVERFRTFRAQWFAELCTKVLEQGKVAPPDSKDPEELRKHGFWRIALALLSQEGQRDAATWLATARLQRLLRMPEQALDSVGKALSAAGGETSRKPEAGDALVERGLLLTMTGKAKEAQPALEKALRSNCPRAAEAGYLLALNQLHGGDSDGAMQAFASVQKRFPDSVCGKKARANTLLGPDERPFGAAFTGFESVSYLPESAYQGLPKDTEWHGEAMAPKVMAEEALRFLLAQQRDDGGFTDSRYAYWPNPQITPNVWVAITAIACTALEDYRTMFPALQKDIDKALQKGEAYMFAPEHMAHGKNEECYAETYRLLYLAHRAEGKQGSSKKALIERMNAIVKEAAAIQRPTGFWAHEYDNAFCTGAVLWGLLAAKQSGASVPTEVTDKGAAALLSARYETGSFVYGGSAKGSRPTGLKDAVGRMPVCEGALLALGRSDLDKVRFSMTNFWQYLENLEGIRRNDFHSDGELGGFFFFHAVYHASEVVKLLPENERAEHYAHFVTLLQQIPEMDGSFLDSHELGRSYGTAMALLTLHNAAF